MRRYLLLVLMQSTLAAGALFGQAPLTGKLSGPAKPVPTMPTIDEGVRVTLGGNTRPEANAVNDRGVVPDSFPMEHLMLQLRRSPAQEQALEQFIDQLHDPKSPNYHQWLSAQEFGAKYGLPDATIGQITGWLGSQGFVVNVIYPNHMVIDLSGTAGQIRRAFRTEIHQLQVLGARHYANMSDPKIPAAFAPIMAGIVSMNDFRPRPMIERRRPNFTTAAGNYAMVPADLAKIYNFNPLFTAGHSGQGQTIVVVEDTNVYSTSDWTTFRTVLGLSGYSSGSFTQVHPPSTPANNCTDPGVNGDDGEAILDAEWSSAAAPNAAIVLASCTDTGTFGGHIALQNLLNASSTPPAIVSISYGDSETDIGTAYNAFVNSLHQQAVTEGVSIFVSSGDQAAAVTDRGATNATHGINVNGFGSTPYNVSVGGTDFGDTYAGTNSTYWSATNGSTYGSALSYVPEIPWGDSCASVLIATFVSGSGITYGSTGFCNSATAAADGLLNVVGGSGGPSGCATGTPSTSGVVSGSCAGYAKPSWQAVFGNPSDGVRDLPDVSLFAADGTWGHYYIVCYSDVINGGTPCTGAPDTWSGFGGTSISSPIMAGIQALINQSTGSRVGNPNPTYYSLASSEYGAGGNASCSSSLGNGVASNCIFYDVTQGDMDVPCTGTFNCYRPSGTYGVLSTSNSLYKPAYGTTTGWDFATGIGTVNAFNLVAALSPPTVSVSPPSLGFSAQAIGTSSNAKALTLSNVGLGTLNLSNFAISGSNSGDFSLSQSCPGTLNSGANCQLNVTFKPTGGGPRKSSISINDNAAGSPQTIILTGLGAAISPSPASLTFTSQTVGTSSSPQTVTITNKNSTTTVNLWQIGIIGANPGDFSKTTTCGSTLAGGASCTVSVTFKPTATGTRTASLALSDDGGASPQVVGLTGTGS